MIEVSGAHPSDRPDVEGAEGRDDLPPSQLDDEIDRDELRRRYYGLLQELRVLLPGVQILVAFLLTVPFASGFDRLDPVGRDLFLVSLLTGMLAIVAFLTPTAFHRMGPRRSRSARLIWGVRSLCLGLVWLSLSLLAALAVVVRSAFSTTTALVVVAAVGLTMAAMWVVLPRAAGSPPRAIPETGLNPLHHRRDLDRIT